MLRGCSIAWMPLTISLASGAGDHLPAEPDALLAWASIRVSHPSMLFVFCGRRNSASRLSAPAVRDGDGNKQFISLRVNTRGADAGRANLRALFRGKRKGLQLALEPLNGQGIAGYVPEPELWTRSLEIASRENLHIVSALRVLGDVEAFTLGLDIGAQADDDVDDIRSEERRVGKEWRG